MKLKLRKDERAIVFELLIAGAMAVIMLFALMNVGTYINGTISSSLINSYPAAASRTTTQNATINTLNNLTGDFDSSVDIVSVAAIITVITIPLAAVVAIKKLW